MRGILLKNEPLAKYTSWRVGGPAERMYFPQDKQDIVAYFLQQPKQTNIFWLGLGSNLLVRDGGIKGTVINVRGRLKIMRRLSTHQLYVEVGTPCALVARLSAEQGLSGAEFLAVIPGTMGGALKMNAGAFGSETWQIVESVEMINSKGQVTTRHADQFKAGYRTIEGDDKEEWFLSAILTLKIGKSHTIKQTIKTLLAKKSLTQPCNKPTCGSVFKNPTADYAARLIELSGLKGYQLRGACVSKKHANFIENMGNASASDIEALIKYIQQKVWQDHQVHLETEVCGVGIP